MITPPLSPDELLLLSKRLEAAQSYLDLGMAMDAWNELEEIEPELRGRPEVLTARSRSAVRWRSGS